MVRDLRPRGADGRAVEVLSTLSEANVAADARAFAALMQHVRKVDGAASTVVMVQVENEVGLNGSTRDRSAEANKAFAAAVPAVLLETLRKHKGELAPEMS